MVWYTGFRFEMNFQETLLKFMANSMFPEWVLGRIFWEEPSTKKWKSKLRPTKGIHLVFSKKTIPIERAVVMAVEKRIVFVIPRHDMVIVGTTDTDYERNPEEVSVEAEDVDYLLKALNQLFPLYSGP